MDLQDFVTQLERILRIGITIIAAYLVALWIASVWWTFRDIRARTTDHLEYRWFEGVLHTVPSECLVVYVGEIEHRNMMLPIFGRPARPPRKAVRIDARQPYDLPHLIDGADAARFLRWIAEAFEQPFLLSVQG